METKYLTTLEFPQRSPYSSVVEGCQIRDLCPLGHLFGSGAWTQRHLVSTLYVS